MVRLLQMEEESLRKIMVEASDCNYTEQRLSVASSFVAVSEQSTTLEWPHSSMRSCRRHRLVADTVEMCNNMVVGMGNLT